MAIVFCAHHDKPHQRQQLGAKCFSPTLQYFAAWTLLSASQLCYCRQERVTRDIMPKGPRTVNLGCLCVRSRWLLQRFEAREESRVLHTTCVQSPRCPLSDTRLPALVGTLVYLGLNGSEMCGDFAFPRLPTPGRQWPACVTRLKCHKHMAPAASLSLLGGCTACTPVRCAMLKHTSPAEKWFWRLESSLHTLAQAQRAPPSLHVAACAAHGASQASTLALQLLVCPAERQPAQAVLIYVLCTLCC